MDMNSIIASYEIKPPSYKLIDRPKAPSLERTNARFVQNGSIWRSVVDNKDTVSILITGDLLCQEGIMDAYKAKDGWNFNPLVEFIRPLLTASDLAIGNLETPISHTAPYRGDILTHEGVFFCNAPREYLQGMQHAGFDMLTTANNHTADAGARGILETIQATQEAGFIQTGTNATEDDQVRHRGRLRLQGGLCRLCHHVQPHAHQPQ